MNVNIYGLAAFIIQQPADRKITGHGAWANCAVGDYAREVHGHEIPLPIGGDFTAVWKDPVLRALVADEGTAGLDAAIAYSCRLVEEVTLMDLLADMDDALTYGELRYVLGDALLVQPNIDNFDPIADTVGRTGILPG